ncbi:hypothetical protein ACERII_15750 [Evansella sp. AB-rgal1]|uniref:hypothetical protein n=1 Tax=Evansella sp. AB-rgal1 TaxID=3242696 RepID=UPI00359D24BC
MDNKKKMIIKEIEYWKQNRLLPEVYCNFLLSLYTQGEQQKQTKTKFQFLSLHTILNIMLVATLIALSFVGIYFTQFSLLMQITLSLIFFCVSLFFAIYFHRRGKYIAHIYVVATTFLSFLFVLQITEKFFSNQSKILGAAVALLCAVWIVIGLRWKYRYLTIGGIFGLLIYLLFYVMLK